MSTSGSSPPPTPPKGAQSFPPSRAETAVEILRITGELRDNARAAKIKGTVTRIQKDGTAHIRTDKGEITVKIRGRERLQEGEEIEVHLPAGKSPRTARLADIPKTETPPPPPDQPAETPPRTERSADRADTSPRLSEDVSRSLQKLPQEQPQPVRQDKPLRPQDLVRLLPVTPAKLEALIHTAQFIAEDVILPALPPSSPSALSLPVDEAQAQALTTSADTPPRPELARHPLYTAPLVTYLAEGSIASESAQPLQIISPFPAETGAALFVSQAIESESAHRLPTAALLPHNILIEKEAQSMPSLMKSGAMTGPAFEPALQIAKETFATPSPSPFKAFLHNVRSSGFIDLRVMTITPSPVLTARESATQTPQHILKQAETTMTAQAGLPKGQAGEITASVIAKTANNLPVLRMGNAPSQEMFFILQTEASNLLPGTEITFLPHTQSNIVSGAEKAHSPSSASQMLYTGGAVTPSWQLFGSFEWPALEQIQQSLQAAAPQVAAMLSQKIPNPAAPQRLPATALFFIAAVKAGDVDSWLGNKAVETIRKLGKASSLSRLNSDFLGLNKTGSDPVAQDWRALALPLNWQDQIDKAMFYYRQRQDDEHPDNERGKMTRFIFDLNLSRMGKVQLDGLHRGPRLDMIVRTHSPLSTPMKQVMRQKYTSILETCSMSGVLQFQDDPEQWVIIDMKSTAQAAALNI